MGQTHLTAHVTGWLRGQGAIFSFSALALRAGGYWVPVSSRAGQRQAAQSLAHCPLQTFILTGWIKGNSVSCTVFKPILPPHRRGPTYQGVPSGHRPASASAVGTVDSHGEMAPNFFSHFTPKISKVPVQSEARSFCHLLPLVPRIQLKSHFFLPDPKYWG